MKRRDKHFAVPAIFGLIMVISFLSTSMNLRFLTHEKEVILHASRNNFNLELPARLLSVETTWNTMEKGSHIVLPNVMTRQIPVRKDDVTLLVHLSATPTKLARFLFLLHRWDGPSSVALYVTSPEEITTFTSFCRDNMKKLVNADFHIVLENTKLDYPQNRLRELILQHTRSDYFVALDVDFMPPTKAHERLRNLIRSDVKLATTLRSKTIAVLPAFNYLRHLDDDELTDNLLPNTKKEVVRMVEKGEINEFHMEEFGAGHGATNYNKWYKTLNQNESFYLTDYEMKFEPYVLGYRDEEGTLPHYWEDFRGFGYDKYSWFMEVFFANYKYIVLNDFYVIHLDHPYSSQQIPMRNSRHMDNFMNYLRKQYGATNKELDSVTKTVKWAKRKALKLGDKS